ncbi:ABC transporter substrate-binding protein [Clostridium magnum]|uniref:Cystine-binding periplasmic protein n=1 Tax=Clostridium magnum DSM 2767 TaxID=1121326 RepID=A0A161X692_9CLOT|nr:ABC transporter substrate-binding protein [Clostridium magnum]KZL89566.1 cystine-binding periplasmic protein precursor [Clostridium magnum DSM 2767]SHH72655.1 amino acid ABC transporter substrate-binding protein, PAAT family (TC 3.A.1.3.-) [Clostridium magnum DSM 2767]
MKKIFSMFIILVLSISVLAGCGQGTSESKLTSSSNNSSKENSLDRVKKAGKIIIGIDDTYPPMEFKDKDNKLVGYDIDIANEIGKKLGTKVEFVPTAWDGIFMALQSKKFDVIHSSVSITDERKKTMIFTEPYIYGGNAIFVKADNTTVNSQDDFKGKIIGCQVGTTAQDALSKISGMKEVKKYNGMTEAFLDLKNGRIDAVVSDPQVGDYYIASQKDKFKKIKSLLSQEPIGVAFRKDDTDLRDGYQKAMDELKKDGTLSKLSEKWFGYDIYKENQ